MPIETLIQRQQPSRFRSLSSYERNFPNTPLITSIVLFIQNPMGNSFSLTQKGDLDKSTSSGDSYFLSFFRTMSFLSKFHGAPFKIRSLSLCLKNLKENRFLETFLISTPNFTFRKFTMVVLKSRGLITLSDNIFLPSMPLHVAPRPIPHHLIKPLQGPHRRPPPSSSLCPCQKLGRPQ